MENLKQSFKNLKWYEWFMAAVMIAIAGKQVVMAILSPETASNPLWLTNINFISAICGVVCIFFCAKAQISNFVFGLINTLVYAMFLWYWNIYGTFCLEMFFYLPMNIISWYRWSKNRDEVEPEKTKAKKLTPIQLVLSIGVVGLITLGVHFILIQVNGNVVWLDALTVAIGLVATFLEMKRYRDQYTWWIVTDIIAVAMYIIQFDPVYLTKKIIYLIMAFIGYMNWSKLNKERNAKNE